MTWYAASVIVAVRLRKGRQRRIPVYENVYLIEARSDRDARKKAEAIGKKEEIPDNSLRLNGKPARFVYAGVRKVITVSNPFPRPTDAKRPRHGTELTYSLFELNSSKALSTLVKGKRVMLSYEE